jgi:sec-independent protein translocase protein TatA
MTTLPLGLGLVTFGITEMVLLLGVLMLLFGAKKLPMLARGLGTGIRNFKGELGTPSKTEDEEEEVRREP